MPKYPTAGQVTSFSSATTTGLSDLAAAQAAYDALIANEQSLQEDIEAANSVVQTKRRELEILSLQIASTFRYYDDAMEPVIILKSPLGGATGVSANVQPVVVFSKPLDPATVIAANIFLDRVGGSDPSIVLDLDDIGAGVTITPDAPLVAGATYQIVCTTSVLDTNGLALQEKYVQAVAFTIAA